MQASTFVLWTCSRGFPRKGMPNVCQPCVEDLKSKASSNQWSTFYKCAIITTYSQKYIKAALALEKKRKQTVRPGFRQTNLSLLQRDDSLSLLQRGHSLSLSHCLDMFSTAKPLLVQDESVSINVLIR